MSPIFTAESIHVLPKNRIAPYSIYSMLLLALDNFSSSPAFKTKVIPFRRRNINNIAPHKILMTSRSSQPLELAQPGNAIGFG